jgi:hypothetical protein
VIIFEESGLKAIKLFYTNSWDFFSGGACGEDGTVKNGLIGI